MNALSHRRRQKASRRLLLCAAALCCRFPMQPSITDAPPNGPTLPPWFSRPQPASLALAPVQCSHAHTQPHNYSQPPKFVCQRDKLRLAGTSLSTLTPGSGGCASHPRTPPPVPPLFCPAILAPCLLHHCFFFWPNLCKCDPLVVLSGSTLGVTFPEIRPK